MKKPSFVNIKLKDVSVKIHPKAKLAYEIFLEQVDLTKISSLENHISNPYLTSVVPVFIASDDTDYWIFCDFINYVSRINQPEKKFLYLVHSGSENNIEDIQMKAWLELVNLARSHQIKSHAALYSSLKEFMPTQIIKRLTGKLKLSKNQYSRLVGVSYFKLTAIDDIESQPKFIEKNFQDIISELEK